MAEPVNLIEVGCNPEAISIYCYIPPPYTIL